MNKHIEFVIFIIGCGFQITVAGWTMMFLSMQFVGSMFLWVGLITMILGGSIQFKRREIAHVKNNHNYIGRIDHRGYTPNPDYKESQTQKQKN